MADRGRSRRAGAFLHQRYSSVASRPGMRSYVVIDAHKNGRFHPHVFASTDRGRTWRSIAGDLPENEIVWSLEQDHVAADLLFVGAEFGCTSHRKGGAHWVELTGGVPTISFVTSS